MEIIKTENADVIGIALKGRLDASTAPDLEAEFTKLFEEGKEQFELDLEGLEYISSAGLRVLLFAQKTVNTYENGKMVLRNVGDAVMDVFDMTGFTDILTIE